MTELKTKPNKMKVSTFLDAVENVKSLDDIDRKILRKLIERSVTDIKQMYACV